MIVIIITDKILHGIFRKEALKFAVELGRKRFVMGNNQGRFADILDHIGHGKCFATSCDAKKRLIALIFQNTAGEVIDRFRLIARGLITRI